MTENTRKPAKTPGRVIGLDVHPDSFTAAILVGPVATDAVVEKVTGKLPIDQLADWVGKYSEEADLFVLEATANAFELVGQIEKAGCHALVLDSVKVGRVSKSYCQNDKVSAVKIARVYLSGLADSVWVPDPETRRRRDIYSAYEQVHKDKVRAVSRLRGYLNEYNVRMGAKGQMHQDATRKRTLSARPWREHELLLINMYFDELVRAEQQEKKFKRMMAEEILHTPELLKMLRIFGLGHITIYALAAYVGNIRRFRSPKKLVAYIGLNPRVAMSGEGDKRRYLYGNGRKELRRVLVEAAHCIFQHKSAQNPLYNWGWRLSHRKGKKVAVIGVTRKIITAVWYLLMGKFTPLEEASKTLKYKIRLLARFIGAPELRRIGHKNYEEFIAEKINIIQNTA